MINRDEWKALSEKARWDIKASLRGPDCVNSDKVKYYTSAVIRGEVRGVMRVGGMVNDALRLVVIPSSCSLPVAITRQIPSSEKWKLFQGTHFFEHVREAAGWLGIPLLYLTSDTWGMLMASKTMPDADLLSTFAGGEGESVREVLTAYLKANTPLTRKELMMKKKAFTPTWSNDFPLNEVVGEDDEDDEDTEDKEEEA